MFRAHLATCLRPWPSPLRSCCLPRLPASAPTPSLSLWPWLAFHPSASLLSIHYTIPPSMTLSQRQQGGVWAALLALSEECNGAAFILVQISRLVPSQSHCHVVFHTQIAQKSAEKANSMPTRHFHEEGWLMWAIIKLCQHFFSNLEMSSSGRHCSFRCFHISLWFSCWGIFPVHVNAFYLVEQAGGRQLSFQGNKWPEYLCRISRKLAKENAN